MTNYLGSQMNFMDISFVDDVVAAGEDKAGFAQDLPATQMVEAVINDVIAYSDTSFSLNCLRLR